MPSLITKVVNMWLGLLRLPRQLPKSWYEDRLKEEIEELKEAKTFVEKLSETSDVIFTSYRAQHDGHLIHGVPYSATYRQLPIVLYMFGKFTSRWAFYKTAATIYNPLKFNTVHEVVNPLKDAKLEAVAQRNQLNPAKFARIARCLRRFWPLFP